MVWKDQKGGLRGRADSPIHRLPSMCDLCSTVFRGQVPTSTVEMHSGKETKMYLETLVHAYKVTGEETTQS